MSTPTPTESAPWAVATCESGSFFTGHHHELPDGIGIFFAHIFATGVGIEEELHLERRGLPLPNSSCGILCPLVLPVAHWLRFENEYSLGLNMHLMGSATIEVDDYGMGQTRIVHLLLLVACVEIAAGG